MTVHLVNLLPNIPCMHLMYMAPSICTCNMCRVGQNHKYTVCIRYFWQGNHHIYTVIRFIYTVVANPSYVLCTTHVGSLLIDKCRTLRSYVLFLGLARIIYIVYDRIFVDFPAKNTVYIVLAIYIYIVLAIYII
jgi:hypothetical protein